MKLRAYLADDEPLALKRLARLIEETGRFEIAASATDPEAAVEFLSRERVDVLFLDIEMPGMNGFELLARLPRQPAVIFTTAFDQYALRAFEVNAIDYLLKPVEPEQLDRAIRKLERLGGALPEWMRHPDFRAVLSQIAASLKPPEPPMDRIASRVGERVQFIDLARVTHFFAQDKLTFAACAGKNYCVDHTIAQLEQKLARQNFPASTARRCEPGLGSRSQLLVRRRRPAAPQGRQAHRAARGPRPPARAQAAAGVLNSQ